jgi:fucose permease
MNTVNKYLLFVAYAGYMLVAISGGALNVAWLFIQDDFDLPLSSIGVLLAFPSVVRLFVSFYSGRLLKWIGVGKFLLMGCMFATIGMLGFAIVPSWELLVITAMMLGLGNAGLINGLNIFVTSNYASSRVNWLHACFGLGATAGPILITVIVLDLGLSWRVGYVVMATMVIALGLMMLVTWRDWHLPTTETVEKAKPIQTKGVFRSPVVWLGIGIMALSAGIETSTGQLSNNLFVDGRGFDPRTVATWISLYWLSFTAGRFLTGVVIDRVNHNLFLRVSTLFAVVGASLIWLNPSPIINFAALVIMGFAMAPIAPTIFGDTPRRVGIDRAPYIIGYQSTGAGLGIAFFPAMAGALGEVISIEMIGLFLILLTMIQFIMHELMIHQENLENSHNSIK